MKYVVKFVSGTPAVATSPIFAFVRETIRLALTRPAYTVEMLCDLVARLHALAPEDQARVWEIIDKWRSSGARDEEVAKLREGIRITFFSRWGRSRFNEQAQRDLTKKAKEVYARFAAKAVELGGSPSAEHGIGKIKTEYMRMMYGERGVEEIRRVKAILDPKDILCRGNLIGVVQ